MPVLIIIAILAVVGILGFGTSAGISKKQVRQEVTQLLNGIPQRGVMLGSPRAPLTVWVYADLECPTVKLFVENYLPSIIDNWVRTGIARMGYRSFETDTSNEEVFFTQETAALGAGRQDKMWNFAATFVRQQGEARTDYVTDEYLADIASQVPGLDLAKWHADRSDALLSKQVALGIHSGHTNGVSSTPSLLVEFSEGEGDRRVDKTSIRGELDSSLRGVLETLRQESREDFPTVISTSP